MTKNDEHLFLGIDVGTGGVRAVVVTQTGTVLAQGSVSLHEAVVDSDAGLHEQYPGVWYAATCEALSELMGQLKTARIPLESLLALAVDGTSGTLVCLDAGGRVVRPAIMYDDGRAGAEAAELNALAEDFCARLGYRFNASFALAKMVWVQKNEPGAFEGSAYLIHQADYILGCLSGEFGISDYSNALKTGYDLLQERWPEWIDRFPGLRARLPRVVPPGTQVGRVCHAAAERSGLPRGLPIVTGASDGTAACLASGVAKPGDYNTTLGTTLVFKGVSRSVCRHPQGLIYSHRLPGGLWLPGAASNAGGAWIRLLFPEDDLRSLDALAGELLPSPHIAYPLVQRGERFPFLSATAEGFCVPEPRNGIARYAAYLQGVAFVERLGYEVFDQVVGASGGTIFSTGGGSRSDVWMQCRADVLGRELCRPALPDSAFGSAILAAAGTLYATLGEAVQNMVHLETRFSPNPEHVGRYDEFFEHFRAELERRGYL